MVSGPGIRTVGDVRQAEAAGCDDDGVEALAGSSMVQGNFDRASALYESAPATRTNQSRDDNLPPPDHLDTLTNAHEANGWPQDATATADPPCICHVQAARVPAEFLASLG